MKSVDKDSIKQWPICQIEDKRAEIKAAQNVTEGELDFEKLRQELDLLNEEKKRRGYR